MIFEGTVVFNVTDNKGNDKQKKESVILDNCDTFTEVEGKLFELYGGQPGIDVTAIKRSRLKEIANTRNDGEEKVFVAELVDIFTDDNGKEKELSYKIAFFAMSMDAAKSFIDQFVKQGYDMRVKSFAETDFVDVIQ